MSTISAGNTTTTTLTQTGDTSGNLVFNAISNLLLAPSQNVAISPTGNVTITAVGGIINAQSTTGGLVVPTGTDAQRPANAVAGTIRYNTSNNNTEIYSGIGWVTITAQTYSVSYLVVAGGGGAGDAN
jgi:hypothetical protein